MILRLSFNHSLKMCILHQWRFEKQEWVNNFQSFQDGKVDLTFFAPDCFHFSKFGHAVVSSLQSFIIEDWRASLSSVFDHKYLSIIDILSFQVAKNLWNTIIQPVGKKQKQVNLSDDTPTLNCPLAVSDFEHIVFLSRTNT